MARLIRYIQPTKRTVVTAPTDRLVSADALRSHMRLPASELDDTDAQQVIDGGQDYLESRLNRPLAPQTWDFYYPYIPGGDYVLRLPVSPSMSVDHVRFVDSDGTETMVDATKYEVIGTGAHPVDPWVEVHPREENLWDEPIGFEYDYQSYPFRVRMAVGWATDAVPQGICQALLNICTDWQQQRMSGSPIMMYRTPQGTDRIVAQYRLRPDMVG